MLASGAAKNVMSKSMFLEVSTVETEIQEREGVQKKLEKTTSRTVVSKTCSSELVKDMYAKARGKLQT